MEEKWYCAYLLSVTQWRRKGRLGDYAPIKAHPLPPPIWASQTWSKMQYYVKVTRLQCINRLYRIITNGKLCIKLPRRSISIYQTYLWVNQTHLCLSFFMTVKRRIEGFHALDSSRTEVLLQHNGSWLLAECRAIDAFYLSFRLKITNNLISRQ